MVYMFVNTSSSKSQAWNVDKYSLLLVSCF